MLAVRGDSPIKTLAEYIAKAKAEPGKITFGTGGVGSGNHLSGSCSRHWAGSTCCMSLSAAWRRA